MNTENKLEISNALSLRAKEFFQEAFNDNGRMYQDLDDWTSFTLEDGRVLDLNAYYYGKYIGVTAYFVTEDGIDTDNPHRIFRFNAGDDADNPLNQIDLDDDEYFSIKNAEANLSPEKVLFLSRSIDVNEMVDDNGFEHAIWLIGLLEDALEIALKKEEK